MAEDEYEIFAKRQWVPLFPATNYCGEFGRGGAVLCAAETLIRSFQILKTAEEKGAQCLKASRRCDDPGGREAGSIWHCLLGTLSVEPTIFIFKVIMCIGQFAQVYLCLGLHIPFLIYRMANVGCNRKWKLFHSQERAFLQFANHSNNGVKSVCPRIIDLVWGVRV